MAQAKAMAPQPQRGPVLAKAALRAAERLGLSGRQLAAIVGVSEPTVSRWKRGDSLPDEGTKPFELAVLFLRVFRSLDAITGGNEHVARAWLTNPNSALASRPIDQMTSVRGLVDVATYLDARRAPL
jgi:transcriptional regulator with XRE-family HTH domain